MDLAVRAGLADRILSLPMSNDLSDDDLTRIIESCLLPAGRHLEPLTRAD